MLEVTCPHVELPRLHVEILYPHVEMRDSDVEICRAREKPVGRGLQTSPSFVNRCLENLETNFKTQWL